jgi:hypothetical protein
MFKVKPYHCERYLFENLVGIEKLKATQLGFALLQMIAIQMNDVLGGLSRLLIA